MSGAGGAAVAPARRQLQSLAAAPPLKAPQAGVTSASVAFRPQSESSHVLRPTPLQPVASPLQPALATAAGPRPAPAPAPVPARSALRKAKTSGPAAVSAAMSRGAVPAALVAGNSPQRLPVPPPGRPAAGAPRRHSLACAAAARKIDEQATKLIKRSGQAAGAAGGKSGVTTEKVMDLQSLNGRTTRDVQADGVVVERTTRVLWDKKRTIAAKDITDEHRLIQVQVEQHEVTKPRRVTKEVVVHKERVVPETLKYEIDLKTGQKRMLTPSAATKTDDPRQKAAAKQR